MDDHLNPQRDPVGDRNPNQRWRDMEARDYGYTGPVIAVVVMLLIGLLLFSNWGSSPDQPDTRVGQNTERTTPTTPATPSPRPTTPQ